MIKFHKDGTQPRNGEVFVFGSNLAGIHGAGAARAALNYYGAVLYKGVGRHGQSYAIPTKDRRIHTLSLDVIENHVAVFLDEAKRTPETEYWLTAIGCGLAGYNHSEIAPMFNPPLENISYPDVWEPYLTYER